MASITKTNGGWLAQVRRKDINKSKRFRLKTDAVVWAAKIEADLEAHSRGDLPKYTLLEAMDKYNAEVIPKHKAYKSEGAALSLLKRSCLPINKQISSITSADIAGWRDWRNKQVSDGSVNREFTVLKLVFSMALKEWGWLAENPCLTVKKRPQPKARNRLASDEEQAAILDQLQDSKYHSKPYGIRHQTRIAFVFALETAMRASEILNLHPKDISGRVARLRDTKNGTAREVPLSKRALAALAEIEHDGIYFTIKPGSLSQAFAKARKRAGIINLTFHDSRHTAITRLAKLMSVLALARMVGHNDLKSLMIYYNESAENLADLLD